jgi:glutathione S-transferase
MIVVQHLNNSRSQRVLWLLEELCEPYEIKRYERDYKTMLAPPALTREHLRYRYWLHYAEGSLMPPLLLKLVFDTVEESPLPLLMRPMVKPILKAISGKAKSSFIMPQINTHLDYLEAELAKSKWFAGDEFSAADVALSFPIEAAVARGGLDASRPLLMIYLNQIHARPAYQRALERGGEYELAGRSQRQSDAS